MIHLILQICVFLTMWKYDWIPYVWSIFVLLSFKQVKLIVDHSSISSLQLQVHPTCTLIIDNNCKKIYSLVQWHDEFLTDRPKVLTVNIQNQSLTASHFRRILIIQKPNFTSHNSIYVKNYNSISRIISLLKISIINIIVYLVLKWLAKTIDLNFTIK